VSTSFKGNAIDIGGLCLLDVPTLPDLPTHLVHPTHQDLPTHLDHTHLGHPTEEDATWQITGTSKRKDVFLVQMVVFPAFPAMTALHADRDTPTTDILKDAHKTVVMV